MDKKKEKINILIAEDVLFQRNLLKDSLESHGFNVTSAVDGQEALDFISERHFPILITDLMMPGIDGLELCRHIRKKNFGRYVYIIILTTKSSKEDIVTGLDAGADDYLAKPFHGLELIARLNTGIRILNLEKKLRKANNELVLMAVKDPLTGCFNREFLNMQLPSEIRRTLRYKTPMSVILLDIDFFKNVNDKYGHLAGDEVLKEFVMNINKNIRDKVDWVVRYGGEEFLIVIPDTDLNGAFVLGERIRTSISEKIIKVNGHNICITASYGAVECPLFCKEEHLLITKLINQADTLLYEAKNMGRNQGLIKILT